MGRSKLKMELIKKEKSRILTMKKRKEGLTKKLHQLMTLCDVPGCMIIYDPTTNSSSIWPPDSDNVRRLIDGYKAKCKDPTSVKSYGLSDFFNDRQKQIEEEVLKLRKKNEEGKYPTWDDCLGSLDESQLRGLTAALRGKADAVRSRIEFLKRESEESTMMINELFDYSNMGPFYSMDQDINSSSSSAAAAMDVMGFNSYAELHQMMSVPNYYATPPLPLSEQQPYTLPPIIDNNQNYYYCSSSMDMNQWCYDDGDYLIPY